jgi:hypothetical protein
MLAGPPNDIGVRNEDGGGGERNFEGTDPNEDVDWWR